MKDYDHLTPDYMMQEEEFFPKYYYVMGEMGELLNQKTFLK